MGSRRLSDVTAISKQKNARGNGPSVAVIHHGALGDLVTAFPLFRALAAAGVDIHLFSQGHLAALAHALGLVQKPHALESARFAALYGERPAEHAQNAFDTCDAVLAVTRSESLIRGISRIFKKPVYRIPPRPEPSARIHAADHLLSMCAETGLIENLRKRRAERPWAAGGGPQRPFETLWMHPGAGSPVKRWPLDRFVETAFMLREKKFHPAFLLGPAEFSLHPALTACAPDFQVFRTSDISGVAQFLKSARAFIGNDSGISHLAAFLGLPTVTVFGPTDPARWRPLGPATAVVQGVAPCAPCFETRDIPCRDPVCLKQITPRQVLDALFRIHPDP